MVRLQISLPLLVINPPPVLSQLAWSSLFYDLHHAWHIFVESCKTGFQPNLQIAKHSYNQNPHILESSGRESCHQKKYAACEKRFRSQNLPPRPADNQYSNNSPVSGGNGWSKWWTQRFHNCITGLTGQMGWWFSMNWHEFGSLLLCKAPESPSKTGFCQQEKKTLN